MKEIEQGSLSIESNNIFTILKKWLYTESDVVFRELVSNASDAIQKRGILSQNTGACCPDGQITVTIDAIQKQLIISDNGIGMDYDEIHQYINTIAFSGAKEFVQRNNQSGKDSIIGCFGVGFYSAFMLTDHVAIETKSYKKQAPAVRWDCTADMSYRMTDCEKDTVGTDIILYLEENNPYLLNPALAYESLEKYFIFSRYNIYFNSPAHEQLLANDTDAIWRRAKSDISIPEMNAFYKEFFNDTADPVFWLQFSSIDIGLRGILFFRNTKHGTNDLDGEIRVYSRGIYVGKNLPELIPRFVNLQSGILECDNLPLIISRSGIHSEDSDDMLKLIYECLVQEVTIALHNLFQEEREQYESYWPELNAFVKYGIISDKTFASVMMKKVIFEDIYGNFKTIEEYLADHQHIPEHTIYYASDRLDQSHYIDIFRKCKINALLFDHVIDQPMLYKYETLKAGYQFIRIDSNIDAIYRGNLKDSDEGQITTLKQRIIASLAERLGNISLDFTRLFNHSISALIVNDENTRRIADMMEIYGYVSRGSQNNTPQETKKTLLFNLNNPMVEFVLTSSDIPKIDLVLNHLFDLSMLSQQTLRPEDMEAFINRSELLLQTGICLV